MIFVDAFEFSDALTVWHNYHHNYHRNKDAGKELMQYLGIHHYHAHRDGFTMPPEAAHKLRLLLSPYAQTIIRMYYVRREQS